MKSVQIKDIPILMDPRIRFPKRSLAYCPKKQRKERRGEGGMAPLLGVVK